MRTGDSRADPKWPRRYNDHGRRYCVLPDYSNIASEKESGLIVLFCLLRFVANADDGRDGISGEVAAVPLHRLVLQR
jgi:hypothetical protein